MQDKKPTSYPYKAIMPCKDMQDSGNYNHDVLLHTSTGGVVRLSFHEYLKQLSEPHDAAYMLVKVYPEKIKNGPTAEKSLEYLTTTVRGEGYNTEGKSDKVYMAFRDVWAAATNEIMPI